MRGGLQLFFFWKTCFRETPYCSCSLFIVPTVLLSSLMIFLKIRNNFTLLVSSVESSFKSIFSDDVEYWKTPWFKDISAHDQNVFVLSSESSLICCHLIIIPQGMNKVAEVDVFEVAHQVSWQVWTCTQSTIVGGALTREFAFWPTSTMWPDHWANLGIFSRPICAKPLRPLLPFVICG